MSTNPISQEKEILINPEVLERGTSDTQNSPVSSGAMAVVYDALLQAFAQQQKMEKADVQSIQKCISQQLELKKLLDLENIKTVPDYEAIIHEQHEKCIEELKNHFLGDWSSIIDFNQDWKEIEKYIRTGTMPPEGHRLHTAMEIVRNVWNDHDFVGEARNIIRLEGGQCVRDNTSVTQHRETLNKEIANTEQYSELQGTHAQSEVSRMTQTMGTFTTILSAQKEAVSKVFQ